MAFLHSARNFEPFTDPYFIFESVFGGPLFPRVVVDDNEGGGNGGSTSNALTYHNQERALVRSGRQNYHLTHRNHNRQHTCGWQGSAHKDRDGHTTVFLTSRIVRNRRITRTETIVVDPLTGKAKSSVTVTGEDLEPAPETEPGTVVEWLLCLRMNKKAQVTTCPSSSIVGDRNEGSHHADLIAGFRSVYQEFLEEFYTCNTDLITTCQRYMGCAQ